jgi:hypothetical protein
VIHEFETVLVERELITYRSHIFDVHFMGDMLPSLLKGRS